MTQNEYGMIKSHIERQMDQIIYLIPLPLESFDHPNERMTQNKSGMIE